MTEHEAMQNLSEIAIDYAECGEEAVCEALDMAIKALEAVEKIKFIINEKHYPKAEECDYGNFYRCENALMIADIEDVLSALDSEV